MKCHSCKDAKATGSCGNGCGTVYCGKECARLDWVENNHQELCKFMMIAAGGKKRPRSDPLGVDPSDLSMVVFHTLKKTPEMLENLANTFTLEQLRNLKYNKIFHDSLWKNRNFWYYVVRRFRPDLVPGPFDPDEPYKRIAMKRIVAPDQTIHSPGEMDPRLQQVLKVMMLNPPAINTLLTNLTLEEIQGWNRVSVDFRRIVAESNVFWFKMWQRYGDAPHTEVYNFTQNYREVMQMEQPNLFNVVLSIDVGYDNDVELQLTGFALDEFPTMDFRLIDILKYGNVKDFVKYIDSYTEIMDLRTMRPYEEKPDELLKCTYYLNDFPVYEYIDDGHVSLWDILKFSARLYGDGAQAILDLMKHGNLYTIQYHCALKEADVLKVTLYYPEELQAYYYSENKRKWIEDGYTPRVTQNPIVEKTQVFYYFQDRSYYGDNLSEADIDLPAYFTLRGDVGNPLDLDQWGEILVNGEIVPFERLEEKARKALMEREDVVIEFRKF